LNLGMGWPFLLDICLFSRLFLLLLGRDADNRLDLFVLGLGAKFVGTKRICIACPARGFVGEWKSGPKSGFPPPCPSGRMLRIPWKRSVWLTTSW
jgi:hypothetical protein